MNELITLSSGFVIVNNGDYIKYSENTSVLNSILSMNKSKLSLVNKEKLIEENIYVSNTANELYKNYADNNCFDNYIKLLNYTYENLSDVSLYDWFKLQIVNMKISNLVKKHIIDFLTELFNEDKKSNVKLYIPFNLRLGNNISESDFNKYLVDLDKVFQVNEMFKSVPSTWKQFIVHLDKKNKLVEFYKLVFVDFY